MTDKVLWPEEIVWLDSSQLEGGSWMRKDTAVGMMDDLRQRTVGLVVAETEIAVLVARSVSDYEQTDTHEMIEGALVIPKAAIVDRIPLQPKRKV